MSPLIHQYLSNHVQRDEEGGDDSLEPFSTAGIGSWQVQYAGREYLL